MAPLLYAILILADLQAAPSERARQVVELLLAEKYTELHAAFSEQLKASLTLDALRTQVGPSLKQLGKLDSLGEATVQKSGNLDVVVLPARFELMTINIVVSLDPEGRVRGLFFRPRESEGARWQRPAYSQPDKFLERELSIGEGEWKLPGTLTLPRQAGPCPALVLAHGSGPQDRDETVGNHKVFKDLAEGLASRGIAVLRYEKRTRHHAARMAALSDLTVQQETIEDAVKAAELLRGMPEIDAAAVFVLGHSLGGYLMPRIVRQAPWLAGVIILAGNTRPLRELIVEQGEYLLSLEPTNERLKQQLERMREMAAEMRAIEEGKSAGRSLMGMPAAYIRDLKGYDPAAEMRQLQIAALILQGERDYQVRMKDFERWKQALAGRPNVTLKSYPSLNHLFAAGEGKSTPAEYQKPGHVAEEVIEDIARWIGERRALRRR